MILTTSYWAYITCVVTQDWDSAAHEYEYGMNIRSATLNPFQVSLRVMLACFFSIENVNARIFWQITDVSW